MRSTSTSVSCLILACGNTLRCDDGIGPYLASWAEQHFAGDLRVRVVSRHQWTPDLAQDLARAEAVLFIDCAIAAPAGSLRLLPVEPAPAQAALATHHTGAAELLALSQELYASLPRRALLLTIGAGSIEMGESFSPAVTECLPDARQYVAETVRSLLGQPASVDSNPGR
jgi:hydrogenase maturation protease